MRRICVIFDLDGTLVDSEQLCNQALLDLLPDLGESVDALVGRNRGRKLAEIFGDLEQRFHRTLPQDFESSYRARVSELFLKDLRPTSGANEMLDALQHPCCVASSGPLTKIQQALQVTGLERHFGGRVYSSYEVNSWKPDPGLFLHAAGEMGFLPSQCIVVEDSEVGLQAAANAGMNALHYSPDATTAGPHTIRSLVDLNRMLNDVEGGNA